MNGKTINGRVEQILKEKNLEIKRTVKKNVYELSCLNNPEHPTFVTNKHNLIYGNPKCIYCLRELEHKELAESCLKRNVKIVINDFDKKGRILAECLNDNTHPKWRVRIGDLRNGAGCRLCSIKRMGPPRIGIQEVQSKCLSKNIRLIEETFVTTQKTAEFECLNDITHPRWKTAPNEITSKGSGCPVCSFQERIKKQVTPIDTIKEKLLERDIEIVGGEHKGLRSILEYKCLKNDSHPVWSCTVNNLTKNKLASHCPTCARRISSGELEMCDFLQEHNIDYSKRGRNIISPSEIDIYLPKYNIGIEYHGLYWHNENKRRPSYHLDKRVLCEEKGVRLLQFWESEWRDKKDIVKSIIFSKLGIYASRFYARKCYIKEITSLEAKEFLTRTHIMGYYKASKSVGIFYKDKLVSVLSYKRYRSGIDISRFSTELNTQVHGGLSKLLSYVEKNNPDITHIQYFIDLRYGNGDAIIKSGYELEKITLGWWWTNNINIFNRLSCRANMDDRGLTEKEHAKELKLYKLYDAGQAKYIKRLHK